jgi:hypothetical protein
MWRRRYQNLFYFKRLDCLPYVLAGALREGSSAAALRVLNELAYECIRGHAEQ